MSEHPSSGQNSIDNKNICSGDCSTGRYYGSISGKEDVGSMNTNATSTFVGYTKIDQNSGVDGVDHQISSAVKDFVVVKPVCSKCNELENKVNRGEKNLKHIDYEVDKICKVLKTGGDSRNSKSSIWQKLGFSREKQEQSDEEVCNKLTRILSYIQDMHRAFDEQEISLREKIKEKVELKRVNANLQGRIEGLKGEIINVGREVKNIKEYYTIKNEKLFYKYKEEINAMNETIRSLKTDFKEKCDQNIKLKEELEVLREASKIKILELENVNNQLEKRLKSTTENLSIAQNNLKEETRIKQRLQKKIKILKELIYVNGDKLLSEKKMFQDTLYTILDEKERFINKISINDIELEMENHFIANTNKIIDDIMKDVQTYEDQINTFTGNYENKKYLHLREMLIRTLTKLDAIESEGNEDIQNRRRSCISYVKDLQDKLNDKAK